MRKKWIVLSVVCTVFLIGCATAGSIVSDVEKPNYQVVSESKDQNIQIRTYEPMIIAEVDVTGERRDAISNGFRPLADYIFGNNQAVQDIAMTAPVQQQKTAQKIAMTAPVQQQASGDSWKISFVMPSEYSMDTLPQPNNDDVRLLEVPAKTFIAIEFSGISTDGNVAEHEQKLMDYIASNNIQTLGEPVYAFYNPPWTLPFMRRNEIMIEIES